MSKIKRNVTTGKIIAQKPSFEWAEAAAFALRPLGWCLACGEEAEGVEPDARKYLCDCCQTRNVYGAEELVLMGAVL